MFGQLLRKEELQIRGKHLGIGMERPLRMPVRESRAKKKKKMKKMMMIMIIICVSRGEP